jgi:hypothetical protein
MSKHRVRQDPGPSRFRRPVAGHGTAAAVAHRLLTDIGDHGFAWDDVADEILPVFERARPFPFEVDPPAVAIVPPGVTIGFGVDLGLAFARVAAAHLDDWPVDLAGLTDRALRNLRKRTRRARDFDLVEGPVGGVPTVAFQSRDGWASTTVLVPDAMERLFGRRPALFIAPSRDLLIGLPDDVDLEFATWLAEEFEATDPNALRLEAFAWRDGAIACRPLQRATVTA